MDEVRAGEPGEDDAAIARTYLDEHGNPTTDPARAVRGEVIEYPADGARPRRTWFLFEEVEIRWLPVSESAFLLWVLVFLVGVWLAIALVVRFT
jgi:hypothetical protein